MLYQSISLSFFDKFLSESFYVEEAFYLLFEFLSTIRLWEGPPYTGES